MCVYLACIEDEPTPPDAVRALRERCEQVAIVSDGGRWRYVRGLCSLIGGRSVSEGAFWVDSMAQTLRTWGREIHFDAALASASSVAPYLRLPEWRQVPALIDLIDVDSAKWAEYAHISSFPMAWIYRAEAYRVQQLERSLFDWAKGVIVVSRTEAELCEKVTGRGPVHAIGNGVDHEYFRPAEDVESDPSVVFVGALDYRPNVEAAVWFANECWPAIASAHPEARLKLVGRRPSAAVRALGRIGGVEVVGQVPDVRPYLSRARVVIAPLLLARGIQNKVLEALAAGKGVVTSPAALEGIDAVPERDLLVADEPAQWKRQITRLLSNRSFAERLGHAGREYILNHYDWNIRLEPLAQLIRSSAASTTTSASQAVEVTG